jgi:transcriptional regulator with XRE-family HTH domain
MTPFAELAASREYWLTKIQNELYDNVEQYLERQGMTRTQLAEQLGVTKGYVSQLLNGDFDHKLSKLIDLSLAVGVVPNVKFQEVREYVTDYLSGYDMSINADNVSVTIEVTNYLPRYEAEPGYESAGQASTLMLVDTETFVSFDYLSQAA